jgi:hypothetical protein
MKESVPIFCALVIYFMAQYRDYIHMVTFDTNRYTQIKGTKNVFQNYIVSGLVHHIVLRKYKT